MVSRNLLDSLHTYECQSVRARTPFRENSLRDRAIITRINTEYQFTFPADRLMFITSVKLSRDNNAILLMRGRFDRSARVFGVFLSIRNQHEMSICISSRALSRGLTLQMPCSCEVACPSSITDSLILSRAIVTQIIRLSIPKTYRARSRASRAHAIRGPVVRIYIYIFFFAGYFSQRFRPCGGSTRVSFRKRGAALYLARIIHPRVYYTFYLCEFSLSSSLSLFFSFLRARTRADATQSAKRFLCKTESFSQRATAGLAALSIA